MDREPSVAYPTWDPPSERTPLRTVPLSGSDERSTRSDSGGSWMSWSSVDSHVGHTSLVKRIDKYLFEEREVGIPRSRSHRAVIRIPSRTVLLVGQTLFSLAFYSPLNLLIVALPFAVIAKRTSGNERTLTAALEYTALAALPGIFRYGCEFLPAVLFEADQMGRVFLTAFFDAISIDLEVALIALSQHRLQLVQAYICGKVVATCLLTLGICQCVSGSLRGQSRYNMAATSMTASLLVTAFVPFGLLFSAATLDADISKISLPALFILMALYGIYLIFKYWSHAALYSAEPQENLSEAPQTNIYDTEVRCPNVVLCMAMVAIPPVLAYYLATDLLSALDRPATGSKVSEVFVGFFVIPMLAEAAELPQVLRLAWHDRMDQVLEASAGTGVQVALLTAPALLLIALALQLPHALEFGTFEVIALFTSVWIFGYWAPGGMSSYLTGALSTGLYVILCLAAYLHPNVK